MLIDRYRAAGSLRTAVERIAAPRQITTAPALASAEVVAGKPADASMDGLAIATCGALTTAGGGDPARGGWGMSMSTGGYINA